MLPGGVYKTSGHIGPPMYTLSLWWHAEVTEHPVPSRESQPEAPKLKIWYQHDFGTQWTPRLSNAGPRWSHVKRRVIRDAPTQQIIRVDECEAFPNPKMLHFRLPGTCQDIITEFHHFDDRQLEESAKAPSSMWSPNKHQVKQIESQVKACASVALQDDRCLVMEVFSPPRFAKVANDAGFRGRSYDLVNGVDLSIAANRRQVEQDLIDDPPDLLILCPPCTHEGGWWHLNQTHMPAIEVLKIKAQSRSFIRWCCKLFRMQAGQGRRALFEHPLGSQIWDYDEVRTLLRRHFSTKLHQCMYGMQLPDSELQFIRKGTRLLLTHEDMLSLGKTCPGKTDAKHVCHDVIKGSAAGVPSVSKFAGRYPPRFVHAVLDLLPVFQAKPCLMVVEDSLSEDGWRHVFEVLALSEAREPKELKSVIDRLHRNLGHPPKEDMLRILRNAQASEEAMIAAREHSCDFCLGQARPKVALPAQTNRVHDFNHQVGFDVKHLTGWKNGQKVKALNLVDHASSYQRLIPFFEQETSQVLFKLFNDHWISPFGPPKEVILDPARTNLGEDMVSPAEAMGIHIRPIAAEAHYQLGRTESHGGWFDRVLQKMKETHAPTTKDEWLACVSHAHVKNQMLQVHGFSPHQFVFGRNPHVPSDLLSEPLQTAAATASLTDEALAKAQALRLSARRAVIELQDDKAIRLALNARPRKAVDFQPGDYVCYWRNQKWIQGKLNQGGRWYGCAIVLGAVGRNLVIMHRRQVFRVAPEQVRFATSEERTLLSTPQAELLGIKDLIDKGQLKSKQFLDLLPQSYPPEDSLTAPADVTADAEAETVVQPPVVATETPPIRDEAMPSLIEPAVSTANTASASNHSEQPSEGVTAEVPESSTASSSYGPVRRRVSTKEGPMSLWRPAPLQPEDFVEIMHELVPQLVEQASQGTKREREATAAPDAASSPASSRPRTSEVLSVEEVDDLLETCDQCTHEVLISEYMQKRLQKELPPTGNHPQLQRMVDEGKKVEWNTLGSKPNVLKIHYGKQAALIRTKFAHRFIGSRFVLTRKACVEGQEVDPQDLSTFAVKARWCLQGHLDPDLAKKAETGALKSPTLSQLGRMTLMQIIASQQWVLQLGDIRGAFLEAGPMEDCYRPLYAHQPPGGIPGLPPSAVIEVIGNVYGQNNAPSAWFKEFNSVATSIGWCQSKYDSCLYTLRSQKDSTLIGVMGVHVDDTALGGQGPEFEAAVTALRQRFPYRKWRTKSGEFCGAWYNQSADFTVSMNMSAFVDKIRPINVPKDSRPDEVLSPAQVKVLRAVNGSLNWLSSQSRPDLSAQTSLSQQSFPHPKIKDLRMANQAVRRAKQHRDLSIVFKPIDPEKLTLCCHSDAAFANVGCHTQAGYIIGFCDESLQNGEQATWCPVAWRSYKLPRAVSSTLSAEAQAFATASGTVEWVSLLMSEILDGPTPARECRSVLKRRPPILITDCKSLYDHLTSPSSPTAIEDRRTSIDVIIIRESVKALQAFVRWVPTQHMLADALTKDLGDPIDMLRVCLTNSFYHISPESAVLEEHAREKERKAQARLETQTTSG